ncbi:hypothetical protein LYZ90_09360 [Xanthomonas hortorum pv. vitians]|uniref:hypothetical protein n=1 Tax=Xanthomonas hortorum TaxID=56454 RepID=UPI001F255B25|nr:hypothetical protein [Xanthomonas hortorum]MCE4311057.1 hypothetical protein [Xanthomonas hortorum pv. vitians]
MSTDTETRSARSRYRKVEVRTWGDEKFRALSPMPPSGQGLWLYLITGPHTGPIPGLFRAGRAAMAEDLDWELEAFDKAFAEAFGQGMVKADFKARVVWIPKAIQHNRPESPNVVRSWAAEFDLIPECALKSEALECLRAFVCKLGEGFAKAFDEAFGKPSGKPSPKAMPNQEQEQEQEETSSLRSESSPQLTLTGDRSPPADLKAKRADRIRQIAEDAQAAFNATLAKPNGLLSKCTVLNKPRLKAIEACLPTVRQLCQQLFGSERVTPKFWQLYFESAADDEFYSGRVKGGPGHESYVPDFEVLLREKTIAKLADRALSEAAA